MLTIVLRVVGGFWAICALIVFWFITLSDLRAWGFAGALKAFEMDLFQCVEEGQCGGKFLHVLRERVLWFLTQSFGRPGLVSAWVLDNLYLIVLAPVYVLIGFAGAMTGRPWRPDEYL